MKVGRKPLYEERIQFVQLTHRCEQLQAKVEDLQSRLELLTLLQGQEERRGGRSSGFEFFSSYLLENIKAVSGPAMPTIMMWGSREAMHVCVWGGGLSIRSVFQPIMEGHELGYPTTPLRQGMSEPVTMTPDMGPPRKEIMLDISSTTRTANSAELLKEVVEGVLVASSVGSVVLLEHPLLGVVLGALAGAACGWLVARSKGREATKRDL